MENIVVSFEKVSFEEFKKSILKMCPYLGQDEETIKEIYDGIRLPERSTENAAGFDFFAPFDVTLLSKFRSFYMYLKSGFDLREIFTWEAEKEIAGLFKKVIPTGIKVKMLVPSWFLEILPRSSHGTDYGMRLLNTAGIIDGDYYNSTKTDGDIIIALEVTGTEDLEIKKGDKFCQGIAMPYGTNGIPVMNKRTGGFGSTGK